MDPGRRTLLQGLAAVSALALAPLAVLSGPLPGPAERSAMARVFDVLR
jgi:hypothetical protein